MRGCLDDPPDQVVIVGLSDLAAVEFAGLRLESLRSVVDKDFAIDFRGMHSGASFEQKFAFFGGPLEEKIKFSADQALLFSLADSALDSHQIIAAALDLAGWELIFHRVSPCAFLVGVTERTHPVKFHLADKLAQLVELFLGFPGKARDERRAQRNAGNGAAHLLNRSQKNIRASAALHALQHSWRRVLQRHIDVRANLAMRGDGFEQTAGDLVGISVEKANPAHLFDASQLFQQQCKAILEAKLLAVAGRVLANQRDFAHAGAGQALSFRDNGFKAPRPELTAQLGNNAEAAGMIAALGNLKVCGISWRGENARRVLVIKI